MQTTFLELHDSAMNCLSKNPDIAAVSFGNNLKDLTERFLGLAKGALGSSEGAESGDEDAEGESINEEENGGARSKRRRSRDDGSPGSGGMQGGGGGVGGAVSSYGGYQVSYSRENGNGRGSRSSYDNSGNQNRSAGGGSGRNNTMTTNSPLSSNSHDLYSSGSSESERAARELAQNSPMGFPYPLAPQYKQDNPLGVDGFNGMDAFSYSYQETNFSRRLHRAGLEHAQMMLSSPNPDEPELARLFAYTFCYVSKEKALETVTKLLRINTRDSLDPNNYPEFSRTLERPLVYGDLTRKHESLKTGDVHPASGDEGSADLSHEARAMIVKLGINLKYLGPDEVEQYITDLGILTTTNTSVVDPDLMDVDMELGGPRQKSQPISPTATKPTTPPTVPVLRPDILNPTSPEGGFTSATVMSLEYPTPSFEGQRKHNSARFDKHAQPAAMVEANTKSSAKVLEGVKKYVDLDVFVKRMPPFLLPLPLPHSFHQRPCLLMSLFRIDSSWRLSREISGVQEVRCRGSNISRHHASVLRMS